MSPANAMSGRLVDAAMMTVPSVTTAKIAPITMRMIPIARIAPRRFAVAGGDASA
jgi:hypothetical protein